MAGSITTQTAQAAGLGALSNIIAQYVANENGPFAIAFGPLAKYVLYGILNTPLNCLWQEYLERKFPGEKAGKPVKENPKAPGETNLQNLAIKFALDQTVGAAGNILFFIVVQGLLRGASMSAIRQSVIDDSLSVYLSGLVIWPLVSLISFALLPVERRVVFGCVVGVAWGVYLSLVAMGGDTA